MASIIKRKKSYSVVYNYIDENGELCFNVPYFPDVRIP